MRPLLSKLQNLVLLKRQFHLETAIKEVRRFDTKLPIEAAVTPPSSWFSTQLFHELDKVTRQQKISINAAQSG